MPEKKESAPMYCNCQNCQGMGMMGHQFYWLRWLLGILVLFLIFWLGLMVGELRGVVGDHGFGGYGMRRMPYPYNQMYYGNPGMMMPQTTLPATGTTTAPTSGSTSTSTTKK